MGNDQEIALRVLFITQDDPFYVKLFFEEFFEIYEDLEEVRGVVICKAMNKRSIRLINERTN